MAGTNRNTATGSRTVGKCRWLARVAIDCDRVISGRIHIGETDGGTSGEADRQQSQRRRQTASELSGAADRQQNQRRRRQRSEPVAVFSYFMSAATTARAFRLRRSVYVCPQPTNTMGWPVTYVIEMAAPTWRGGGGAVSGGVSGQGYWSDVSG